MGRQLFLHHYMPALYFGILLLGVGFDLLTIKLVNRKRLMAASLFIFSVIYVYRCFIPITYAEPWTQSLCENAKWRSSWDFDCAQYHQNLEDYKIKKPLVIEGLNKVREAVNSYLGHAQQAKVVEGVNVISDKLSLSLTETSSLEEDLSATGTTQLD
ncbi:MAG: hypothetical protein EXX96DRAFT_100374 [Benjaminiella poitrasii]|nr:MAG: hypothetical protein EXX96DRAFT_100374 [Benjaminiella poitrasii]